jgi:hypothetical protein
MESMYMKNFIFTIIILCNHSIFSRDNVYLYKGKIDQLDSIYINGVVTEQNFLLGYCINSSGTGYYEVEAQRHSNRRLQILFRNTLTGKKFCIKGSIGSTTENIILDSPGNLLLRVRATDFPYAKFKCSSLTSGLAITSETITDSVMKECNFSTFDTISFCPYFNLVAENKCTFTDKYLSNCQVTVQSQELTNHYTDIIKQIDQKKADSIISRRRSTYHYSIALITTDYVCYCIPNTYPLDQFSWHRANYYAIPIYELK